MVVVRAAASDGDGDGDGGEEEARWARACAGLGPVVAIVAVCGVLERGAPHTHGLIVLPPARILGLAVPVAAPSARGRPSRARAHRGPLTSTHASPVPDPRGWPPTHPPTTRPSAQPLQAADAPTIAVVPAVSAAAAAAARIATLPGAIGPGTTRSPSPPRPPGPSTHGPP